MEEYDQQLVDVLKAAEEESYQGYGKFDALNSPFLHGLTLNNAWLRFFWIQAVKECPFHIRPLFGVKTSRNPKGIALFVRSYLFLYEKTKNEDYLSKAKALLEWLLNNPSSKCENLCWGYNFIWQDVPPFLQDRDEPNCIVSVFVGEALIHAYRVTADETYLTAALSIVKFLTTDLPVLFDEGEEKAIGYILDREASIVLNSQVLSGAFLVKVFKHTNDPAILDTAIRLINFTFYRRTADNAWYYTEPKRKSHIRHDNYHTGGILDGLLEYYEETNDDRYIQGYWAGLEYYEQNLFEDNGAPRWMNDQKFPHDIHGSAQGIITFTKAARYKGEYKDMTAKILKWTNEMLYRKSTHDFIYRQGQLIKWNYSLMRWCNAWMARALGEWICR